MCLTPEIHGALHTLQSSVVEIVTVAVISVEEGDSLLVRIHEKQILRVRGFDQPQKIVFAFKYRACFVWVHRHLLSVLLCFQVHHPAIE